MSTTPESNSDLRTPTLILQVPREEPLPQKCVVNLDPSDHSISMKLFPPEKKERKIENNDDISSVVVKHFVDDSCLKSVSLRDDGNNTWTKHHGRSNSLDGSVVSNYSSNAKDCEKIKYVVIVDVDVRNFASFTSVLRFALFISCISSFTCLLLAGGLDMLMYPNVERLRFHIFTSIFTFLINGLFLFVDVSNLHLTLPINWYSIDTFCHYFLTLLYLISSSLLLHCSYIYQKYFPTITEWTKLLIFAAAIAGYVSCGLSILIAMIQCCKNGRRRRKSSKTAEDISLSALPPR